MRDRDFRPISFIVGCFLVAVLTIPLVILLSPYDKEFGYASFRHDYTQFGWIYDRIFKDERPIDIAFLGTSRFHTSVNDRELATSPRLQ